MGLPAEPWSERRWFFNPFAWQLVFFTGFALMRGWIPAPPVRGWLIAVCLAVVLASLPLAHWQFLRAFEPLRDLRVALGAAIDKTDFGLLRYAHFLALAYLAWAAAGPDGARLRARGGGWAATVWSGLLAATIKVGQQSLAVFVFSMVLAQLIGVALDVAGTAGAIPLVLNALGLAALVGVAYAVGWFKSQPWRRTP
ncbi:OpgC [Oceaniovalibus guishaninsula JLT2003]|uniref:OpgC n=1 Tax=Oceaniovalibus guishaninsula JLT2003 TaxID=1231392 RepID=K2H9F1_9RHOB|nr:OpgC [Oceaniovalibus guishaninsula JLT2003]